MKLENTDWRTASSTNQGHIKDTMSVIHPAQKPALDESDVRP